jgi:hypothetical protein
MDHSRKIHALQETPRHLKVQLVEVRRLAPWEVAATASSANFPNSCEEAHYATWTIAALASFDNRLPGLL